jgi:hypothetical protein
MKLSHILTAAFLSCAAVSAIAASPCCTFGDAGRMTGGGSIICTGPAYRYTFGYELHCAREGKPISGPNNLEVNFSSGEHFHLNTLTRGFCTGADTTTPDAPFNTFYGRGTGTLNGSPAWISFSLVDRGEPGAGVDYAAFTIQTSSGNVLQCGNTLEGGNNQAHKATGNKP